MQALPGFSHDGTSNVWRDMANMMEDVQRLQSNHQAWSEWLETTASEEIAKFGYWRVHPSACRTLDENREIRVKPNGNHFAATLGEVYWQHESTDKKGKVVRKWATLREAVAELYELAGLT